MLSKTLGVVGAIALLVAIGIGSFALARSTDKSKTSSTSTIPVSTLKASAPPTSQTVSGKAGFYDVATLQSDLVASYNSTPPLRYHALSATAILDGRHALAILRTKTVNIVENVTISADGQTYIAVAQR